MEIGGISNRHYSIVSSIANYDIAKKRITNQNKFIDRTNQDYIVNISKEAREAADKPYEPKPYIPRGKTFEQTLDKKTEELK